MPDFIDILFKIFVGIFTILISVAISYGVGSLLNGEDKDPRNRVILGFFTILTFAFVLVILWLLGAAVTSLAIN